MPGRAVACFVFGFLIVAGVFAQQPAEEPSPPETYESLLETEVAWNAALTERLEALQQRAASVRKELDEARRRRDAALDLRQSLTAAYAAGEDAPERPTKFQALDRMRRLEESTAPGAYHEALDLLADEREGLSGQLDSIEREQAVSGRRISESELRAEKLFLEAESAGDWAKQAVAWAGVRNERERTLEKQRKELRVLLKRLADLALVLEGERRAGLDTLFFLRREHLFLRGHSELSWAAMRDGLKDLASLPAWSAESAASVGKFAADGQRRADLLRFGGIAVLAVAVVLLVLGALGSRLRRAARREQEGIRAHALQSAQRLLRDLVVAGSLYAVPAAAAWMLPGLSTGVAGLLSRMGAILGSLWLLGAVLREVLAPLADGRTLLGLDPAAANVFRRVARVLILFSLVALPILSTLEFLGYRNRGALEALWLVYKAVVGVAIFALLMRKDLFHRLVPGRESLGARIYHGAVRLLRPVAALLVPLLLVLDALQFDLLVESITRITVSLLGVVIIITFAHRVASSVLTLRVSKRFATEGAPEDERRREAALLGAGYLLFLLLTYAAVWLYVTLSGTDFEGLRRSFEAPLPLQVGSAGREVTWWDLIVAAVILVIFLKGIRPAKQMLSEFVLSRMSLDRGVQYTINTLFGYLLISVGVLFAASRVVDLSSLGYIAAALSVGIGFGLQEIVSNFISGLILLFERPLKVGDTVDIGDTRGVVKHISIRATAVRTLDNIVMLVPNRDFITQSVVNYSHEDPRIRIHVGVGVSYSSDTALVRQVLLEVAEEHPLISKAPKPNVLFLRFGDSSLDFDLLAWISKPDQRNRVRSELRFAIFEAFAKHGIEIPFPQRDLHVRSAEGLAALEGRPVAEPT